MAKDIPERLRHLEAREGLIAAGRLTQQEAADAIRRSLPTMDHAVRLVAAARALLGERGWVDQARGEWSERIHRTAPTDGWLGAFPIIDLMHGHEGTVTLTTPVQGDLAPPRPAAGGDGAAPGTVRPQLRPRGPTMHAGALVLAEGPSSFVLKYDAEGLFLDCVLARGDIFTSLHHGDPRPPAVDPLARPPTEPPPSLLCRADLDPEGHPVDELARKVVELDPGARAPALVRLPAPVPVGAGGLWAVGLAGLRRALFDGNVEAGACFAVADGMEGTAVAWGGTLEEATEAWRGELFRAKPKPPRPGEHRPEPARSPDQIDDPRALYDAGGRVTGFATGRIASSSLGRGDPPLPWPAAVPDKMPAVAIPLPQLPPTPPAPFMRAGFTGWVRAIGGYGPVLHALVRHDPGGTGFTLVGEGVIDLVDPEALDAELDRAEAEERTEDGKRAAQAGRPSFWENRATPCTLVHYRCWDNDRRMRVPFRRRQRTFGPSFDAASLDGDLAGWTVTRFRFLRR